MSTVPARIDGDCIVVPTKTALPRRCVRTNADVAESEYEVWDLPLMSRGLVVVMLIAPIVLLFAPAVIRRRCKLKAGLSKRVRRAFMLRKSVGAAMILLALFSVPTAAFLNIVPLFLLAVISFVPLFWGGFIVMLLLSRPLRNVKCDGEVYWIKGCGPDFLEGLLNEGTP